MVRYRFGPKVAAFIIAHFIACSKGSVLTGRPLWNRASDVSYRHVHHPTTHVTKLDTYAVRRKRSVVSMDPPIAVQFDTTMDALDTPIYRQVVDATAYVNRLLSGSPVSITFYFNSTIVSNGDNTVLLATATMTSQTSGYVVFYGSSVDGMFIVAVHEILHIAAFNGHVMTNGNYTGPRVRSINSGTLVISGYHWTASSDLDNDVMEAILTESTRVSVETMVVPDDIRGWTSIACRTNDHCTDGQCVSQSHSLPGYCTSHQTTRHRRFHTFWEIVYILLSIAISIGGTILRVRHDMSDLSRSD